LPFYVAYTAVSKHVQIVPLIDVLFLTSFFLSIDVQGHAILYLVDVTHVSAQGHLLSLTWFILRVS
jgi:hypothetical protein